MSKYIKNEDGGIHSVDDDFALPKGWAEVSEDDARSAHPALFGIEGDGVESAPAKKSSKKLSAE
jgi:hypothetical protein